MLFDFLIFISHLGGSLCGDWWMVSSCLIPFFFLLNVQNDVAGADVEDKAGTSDLIDNREFFFYHIDLTSPPSHRVVVQVAVLRTLKS